MEKPHLALTHDTQVPSDLLDQFCRDIEAKSLDFQQQELPSRGPQNSLDVFFVSAVAVYVLKPYFEGFLKEAGKDHYVVLREALKGLWNQLFRRGRNSRLLIHTAKGEVKQKYSALFSIYAEINNRRQVKCLIREGCSENEYAAGIDTFLNLIESYHLDVPPKEVEIDLDVEKDYWGTVFIEFDTEVKSLRVVDPISSANNKNKM